MEEREGESGRTPHPSLFSGSSTRVKKKKNEVEITARKKKKRTEEGKEKKKGEIKGSC